MDGQRVAGVGQGDEAVLLPLAAGQGVRVARPPQRQRRRRLRLHSELSPRRQARLQPCLEVLQPEVRQEC